MSCSKARDRLMSHPDSSEPRLVEHLASCAECAAFARRRQRVRTLLAGHHLAVEPDAGFAARVVSRLEQPAPLAWAALRLLPAALAMALVLGIVSQWSDPAPAEQTSVVAEAYTQDVLLWLAEPVGGE